MEYLHQSEQEDLLDIDKAGYYTPQLAEIFLGAHFEAFINNLWYPTSYIGGKTVDGTHEFAPLYQANLIRMKWLQAKDIMDLGFPRLALGIPMYQRGSYTISAYRLLDPTTSRLLISQNGTRVFEGHVKNKSELKRILILNEINFADN